MIDWNNNGKIDPEEVFLTEEILGEEETEADGDPSPQKPACARYSGCLFSLLTLPFLLIMKGLHL